MTLDGMIAILGAPFIGSFLGVVIDRLPAGRPIALDRSSCDHCGRKLGWIELVPLISFILQQGRCRQCRGQLRLFYPLIELAAVLVVLSAAIVLSGWLFWLSIGLGWCLLILAVIDHRHLILPDSLTLPLIPIGLVMAYVVRPMSIDSHLIGAIAGFAIFAAISWLYRLLRGRDGLGLGDAKLLAAAGAWLGWPALPGVVLMAAVTGLLMTLMAAAVQNRTIATSEVAFGPHLAWAFWVSWLIGPLSLAV